MKRLIRIFSALIIVAILLGGLVPQVVQAGSPRNSQEVLPSGTTRITPYETIRDKGIINVNGIPTRQYEAVITNLPMTMSDLRTTITPEWIEGKGADNVTYFDTGNNTFTARVTGTRVSTQFEGRAAAWDPVIFVGSKAIECTAGPTIVDDTIDHAYTKNIVQWTYTVRSGGFLSPAITITRNLRQIQGSLQEYYVVNGDLGGDLIIQDGVRKDDGFSTGTILFAYDKNYKPIIVTEKDGTKTVLAQEFRRQDRNFPYTIDPTIPYSGTTSDAWLYYNGGWNTAYNTVWSATAGNGSTPLNGSYPMWVGQELMYSESYGSCYTIDRSTLYFDTSAIPDGAIVDWVQLWLYVYSVESGSSYTQLQVQKGSSTTYPHDPAIASDYNKSNYSGGALSGASLSSMSAGMYNAWNFQPGYESWINKTGTTKFLMRTTDDIAGSSPGYLGTMFSDYRVGFYQAEYGSSYAPKIYVSYEVPVSAPIIYTDGASSVGTTSAYLAGHLVDDGGAACTVKSLYGTTTAYASGSTPPIDGKTTGQSWSQQVSGLSPGTLYHFTARAENTGGQSANQDSTFLTVPLNVTGQSVTPDDGANDLSWTKGTGSNKTMVVFKTTGYPTSITDGTQVYFDTGASYHHGSLTNGVTYYYSFFSEQSSGSLEQYGSAVTANGTPVAATSPPSVTTYSATDVGTSTATLHGNLASLGGYASSEVWFQLYWGAGSFNSPNKETDTQSKSATGQFTDTVSGLPASTVIHMRAAALNDADTVYGSDIPFTSGSTCAPTMETLTVPAGSISQTSATLYGKVTADGGAVVSANFQYGLTASYGSTVGQGVNLVTGDTYSVPLTGLTLNTTYHYRIVGWNSSGDTGYGDDMTFTTSTAGSADVDTTPATRVGSTTATLGGTVVGDGGVNCQVRFNYGTSTSYGTDTEWLSGYRAGQSFTQIISGLTTSTVYHFRAQISNDGGSTTVEGDDQNFTTVFLPPTDLRATAQSSTQVKLTWTSQGDKTVIKYKTGSFPADRFDGYQAYFGAGSSTTLSSLSSGTTYFIRAWSAQDDGTYSVTYSEDAVTTLSGSVSTTSSETSLNLPQPNAPDWVFGLPNDDAIQRWPGVGLVDTVATSMTIPVGAMWMILIIAFCLVVGGFIALATQNVLITLGVITVMLFGFSMMHLMMGFIAILFAVITGAVAFVMARV